MDKEQLAKLERNLEKKIAVPERKDTHSRPNFNLAEAQRIADKINAIESKRHASAF